jgi:hypothetical protein
MIFLSIVLVSVWAVSAVDTVTVTAASGKAMSMSPGAENAMDLVEGSVVGQGDTLFLATGAHLTLEFDDGSTMDVSGPAQLVLSELSEYARTIDLTSGTINQFVVGEVTSGVRTPYDSFAAVREGTIQVMVDTLGDDRTQITYKLLEGENAKVVDRREIQPLVGETVIVREPGAETAMPTADLSMKTVGDALSFVIGFNQISLIPKDGFTVTPTSEGGIIVECILPEGQFGTVSVNTETPFQQSYFLTKGDTIEFDAGGNVIRTSDGAIVHVFAVLNVRGNYDEAVADPTDASPIGVR